MITIGIDPHKSSLTAVALEPSGEIASTIRLEVNSDTVDRLLAWAIRWTQRQWAVEGAAGLGRSVAQGLAGAGEPVLDVPAQLAARARLLNTSRARKTDPWFVKPRCGLWRGSSSVADRLPPLAGVNVVRPRCAAGAAR